jgi:AcrR family transcriptional regulator
VDAPATGDGNGRSRETRPILRNEPRQARSRERVRRVLDVADEILAADGAEGLSTTRVAEEAEMAVGTLYRYFPDKETIVEALAVRYWSELADLVAGVAEADEAGPFPNPLAVVLETLAAGFRARPGFLALWYGGLRSERVRDATRPVRALVGDAVERILVVHWPSADPARRSAVARMLVLTGDGLIREAFRLDPAGNVFVLSETERMLSAYAANELAPPL